MSDAMSLDDYLAQGGVLTSPANAPPRYRGELMRLMATFVDSELAGSAGFADLINEAPGLKERIAAARIVLEKTDHADRVLKIMSEFGADAARYAVHHPWNERLARDAETRGDARQPVIGGGARGQAPGLGVEDAGEALETEFDVTRLARSDFAEDLGERRVGDA